MRNTNTLHSHMQSLIILSQLVFTCKLVYTYTCQRSARVVASQRTIEFFFTSNAVEAKNTCIVERKRAATDETQDDWSRSPVAK